MEYRVKEFSDLTAKEFLEIAMLRTAVFVVEQNCPYQEIDATDEYALHTWLQEEEDIVGYTRIMDNKESVSFGRVLINPNYRKRGLGNVLLGKMLDVISEKYPDRPIIISAQAHLKDFYGGFGFEKISEVYFEDDIPHIKMKKSNE